MILLREGFRSHRHAREVFAYAGEFANCEQWDSTALRSQKIRPGPTGVGTEYDVECALPVGTLTLRYRVLEWQPPRRVVLVGECRFFTVTDTITVTPCEDGSELDYQAVFDFPAPWSWLESAIRPGFERMGKASVDGLRCALDDHHSVPIARKSTQCGDRWVVPGVARFSRWGYDASRKHWQPVSASMEGKHIVLTGATSGIGLAAARALAATGARLTLVARDAVRGKVVIEQIQRETGNDRLFLELADLSLLADARSLVRRLLEQGRTVDVLINNAGALFNDRRETAEGYEQSAALLLLAPYVLTEGLLPLLQRSDDPRVINVVSGGMYTQKLRVDQLQSEDNYSGSVAYARAKRALMVLTELWAEHWSDDNITVNAMHPGWADTPGVEHALPFFYRLTRRILRTPEQGADTIVWLAVAGEASLVSGQLFLDREQHTTHLLASTRESEDERETLLKYLNRQTEQA